MQPSSSSSRSCCREGRSEGMVVMACGQRLKMSKAGCQALLAANRTWQTAYRLALAFAF